MMVTGVSAITLLMLLATLTISTTENQVGNRLRVFQLFSESQILRYRRPWSLECQKRPQVWASNSRTNVAFIPVHRFPIESTAAITGSGKSLKSFSFMNGGGVTTFNAVGTPGKTVIQDVVLECRIMAAGHLFELHVDVNFNL